MNWTNIFLFVIVGFTIYRVANYLEQRLDRLEEKVRENDTLCDEWMGRINLKGMLWRSKIACELLGIKPYTGTYDKANERKLNEIWDRLGRDKASLQLHYIPLINSWEIEIGGQTRSISRRATWYGKNQCLHKLEVFEHEGESLDLCIYERHITNKIEKLNDKRLSFCLMHHKGFDLENGKDLAFIVAEYPLPGALKHWTKNSVETEYPSHREELGWRETEGRVRDPYQDYFGEYDLTDFPSTYLNNGVSVTPGIGN